MKNVAPVSPCVMICSPEALGTEAGGVCAQESRERAFVEVHLHQSLCAAARSEGRAASSALSGVSALAWASSKRSSFNNADLGGHRKDTPRARTGSLGRSPLRTEALAAGAPHPSSLHARRHSLQRCSPQTAGCPQPLLGTPPTSSRWPGSGETRRRGDVPSIAPPRQAERRTRSKISLKWARSRTFRQQNSPPHLTKQAPREREWGAAAQSTALVVASAQRGPGTADTPRRERRTPRRLHGGGPRRTVEPRERERGRRKLRASFAPSGRTRVAERQSELAEALASEAGDARGTIGTL